MCQLCCCCVLLLCFLGCHGSYKDPDCGYYSFLFTPVPVWHQHGDAKPIISDCVLTFHNNTYWDRDEVRSNGC